MINKKYIFYFYFLSIFLATNCSSYEPESDTNFIKARQNGSIASEGFERSKRFVEGWLPYADSTTGMIPENLNQGITTWNAHNSAADNYAFMVLTSFLLDQTLYNGKMQNILQTEKSATARINTLPDEYSFEKQYFKYEKPDTTRIVFGASEYIKDGLIPLLEYIGPSPWTDRMLKMIHDLSEIVDVIDQNMYHNPSTADEVNGELLQTLSRLYWKTGNRYFLDWAILIGDEYLLTDRNPVNAEKLRLRDHGCEILGGLSELYVTLHFADKDKKQNYAQPLLELMDLILETGRNADGMFFNEINPRDRTVIDSTIVDNWGYIYDAYYSIYLIENKEEYRQAVINCMHTLNKNYRNFSWEGTSQDGYADAIESAINLYNREPKEDISQWIDSEIKVMWAKQQPDGIIEGWHGDGNFARTTLMYCLWKTQGATIQPWSQGVEIGGYTAIDTLYLTLYSTIDWSGKVKLDFTRHKKWLNLPIDYPRINQFPEWYAVMDEIMYQVHFYPGNKIRIYQGSSLREGLAINLKKNETMYLKILPEEK